MKRNAIAALSTGIVLGGAILVGYWSILDPQWFGAGKAPERLELGSAVPASGPHAGADADATKTAALPSGGPSASPPDAGSNKAATGGRVLDGRKSRGEASDRAPAAGSDEEAGSAPTAETPANEQPAEKASTDLPTFDLLRIEPDGSAVVAGRAPAGSRVSLVENERELASDDVGPGGDFALFLNEPLSVGDHQIRIVTASEDGSKQVSDEVAIVSVPPAGHEDQLLAMIEAPNQPSRLVSVPEAKAGPESQQPSSSSGEAANRSARAGEEKEPSLVASTDETVDQPATADADRALAPAEPAEGIAAGDEPAPQDDSTDIAALDRSPAGDPAALADGNEPSTEAQAATDAHAEAVLQLMVEAVEVENGNVFVAGAASRGSTVRVYVDNGLLGEDRASAHSRFLVSGEALIETGDHMIRADELGPDGSISARAEVPFFKPQDGSMAAVAPSPSEPAPAANVTPAPDETRIAAASQPNRTTAPDAAGDRSGPVVESAAQGSDHPATAKSGQPPADAPATPNEQVATLDAGRDNALSPAPQRPTADGHAARDVAPDAAAPDDGQTVTVYRQPALTPREGRALIRRGDTLWAISRETYGLGRRYTVIYLANDDQIRNPDLIYPGQVFRLPHDDGDKASNAVRSQ
ncbi:LysM peptidoglycan-binding domain-containing protein [Consotaella aegiceratis]|uniref:LysM peptidoglycan-binding domain-containing protein n=1 Tax=Consotaella aegiceratis TaxID=3097961 RepID=UPI002F40A70E